MLNTLYCKVFQCPYNKDNICLSDFVFMDSNGMCSRIWNNGQQRPNAFDPNRALIRNHVNVYDTFHASKDSKDNDEV